MHHEVGPWKMAFFHSLTSWSNFHGPISYKINLQSLWALTKCKPNVNQREWPCTKKWMFWFFNHLCPKRAILKRISSLTILLSSIIFIFSMSRYAASVTTPHPGGFIHLELDEWTLVVGEMLLSEEPPPWLGILAKSSLVSECVERACVRWRFHVIVIKTVRLFPLTNTLGFSRGGARDNLTHCVHLKRKLELFLEFDSLPSMWMCVVYVYLFYVLILFVKGGWYSSCSDTRLRFTRHLAPQRKTHQNYIIKTFHCHGPLSFSTRAPLLPLLL